MLAGITRLLERQAERPGKSLEEDVAERFGKQGPKEFAGLNLSRTVRPSRTFLGNLDGLQKCSDTTCWDRTTGVVRDFCHYSRGALTQSKHEPLRKTVKKIRCNRGTRLQKRSDTTCWDRTTGVVRDFCHYSRGALTQSKHEPPLLFSKQTYDSFPNTIPALTSELTNDICFNVSDVFRANGTVHY
ncbi:hypothetical protein F511_40992 [Dorcoceras hygrometricum]|uniref:Uncharacterized protein n=1 Tax=Dorcoceras hygrometricum TaxID=472368 RepID=A0A2Z7AUI6_9LAMI|nr:hypothetical protein F511_40992 [Dorcoceras hygrometricum]